MSELSEALKSCGALQFGEFTLASGAKSDYYIDIKKASTNPEVLRLIARLMAQKMRDEGIQADRIARQTGSPASCWDPSLWPPRWHWRQAYPTS